ncbi:MAG: DUF4412 domain-containing protein [Gammaproteobacteria bacterium]
MKKNILTLAAALCATTAIADTSITMQEQGAEDGAVTVINIRDGKVAMTEGGKTMGLYDAASGSFTQLDHSGKAFMVMDDKAMDAVDDKISDAMKEMEAQLADMPPEQREAMMKMVPGMADLMDRKKDVKAVEIDFTGKSDKVGAYSCKIAKVTTPAGLTSQVCIAKPSALGVSKDDFAAMGAMLDTMQSFANRFGQDAEFPSAKQLKGIPVRMTGADGDVTILTNVSTDELDGAMFEVPAGYKKRSMMDGM